MLFVALPVMNESGALPELLSCIARQTYKDFRLFICINQPDEWWSDPLKRDICEDNSVTLDYLKGIKGADIHIIDKSSPGSGWKGRKHGVGWARKILMDSIIRVADKKDLILSLDADTTFNPDYFRSVADNFRRNPDAVALAVPYFHMPVMDPIAYRAILRYELYMRHYSINIWRIGSPYSFTALGSALACPVWAYLATGGMTPKMSGEDFYFLQKLRKYGRMLFHNPEKVYPQARFSDRVYFGTGPAMIKGSQGDWSSYPIYPYRFFDEIMETYQLFPRFYKKTPDTVVTRFLKEFLHEEDPFRPLRENFRDLNLFLRACHEKVDGLRILQYLKERHRQEPEKDEKSLADFLYTLYPGDTEKMEIDFERLDFNSNNSEDLEKIRMFLAEKEEDYQVSSALS